MDFASCLGWLLLGYRGENRVAMVMGATLGECKLTASWTMTVVHELLL